MGKNEGDTEWGDRGQRGRTARIRLSVDGQRQAYVQEGGEGGHQWCGARQDGALEACVPPG